MLQGPAIAMPGTGELNVQSVAAALTTARMPLLLAGQRVTGCGLREAVQTLCKDWNLPLITTLAAKGLMAEDHPLCLGNAGYAGTPAANSAMLNPEVDLLLVIGADFNERDTLCWHPGLKPASRRIV